MTYRMIIRTETVDADGRSRTQREIVPHITDEDLDDRREQARRSAPQGATRTIRVVPEP